MLRRAMSHRLWGVLVAIMVAGPALAQGGPPPGAPPGGGPPPVGKDDSNAGALPFSDEEVIRNILPPLPADAPKPATDLRNFEGTWVHNQVTVRKAERGLYAERVPFTPLAKNVRDNRAAGARGETAPFTNASAECRPPGQTWLMELYYPFQIYQSADTVTFLFAYVHSRWDIRMDKQPTGKKQYLGDSVGHWDGNTLVVESTNYKQGMWLDSSGTPTSSNAHLTHRIRRVNQGEPMLEIVTTVDDPTMYTKPWSFIRTYAFRPDKTILEEYDCEYQLGASDNTLDTTSYGLQPEPPESSWATWKIQPKK